MGAIQGYAGSLRHLKHRALTALIFFHCRSSSALSFVSLKRRVLRPSDILIPYWKAALGKERDRAQRSQGIRSLPGERTRLPQPQAWAPGPAWAPESGGWAEVLTSGTKSKDKPPGLGSTAPPQVLTRGTPFLISTPPGPRSGQHCHPHPDSLLSPSQGLHSLGQSLFVIHVLAVLLLRVEVPAPQRSFLVTLQRKNNLEQLLS